MVVLLPIISDFFDFKHVYQPKNIIRNEIPLKIRAQHVEGNFYLYIHNLFFFILVKVTNAFHGK